ncbi:MAG: YbbR-like domain-containing protein [Christensenellales bacterium]|jgi:YbbR domain-containing protein
MTSRKTNLPSQDTGHLNLKELVRRGWHMLANRWMMKLVCLLLAIVLWGGIISQDSTLIREKTFDNVEVSAINSDVLLRNGLIVVSGLETLPQVRMKADVPQRSYATVTPQTFNLRIDLSRITSTGKQTLPIIHTSSNTYGSVNWLSSTEVTVEVDEYVARRRIPVQLDIKSTAPAGFYAMPPSVDPALVTISGPASMIKNVVRCVVPYDLSMLPAQAGTQYSALPFHLQDVNQNNISSNLISVTSESVLLDTMLVEQVLYPMKSVDINLTGITTGQPAPGYHVASVTADPAFVGIAGSSDFIQSLTQADVDTVINIEGASEPLIRAVKIIRLPNAQYVSEGVVYITVDIQPDNPQQIP